MKTKLFTTLLAASLLSLSACGSETDTRTFTPSAPVTQPQTDERGRPIITTDSLLVCEQTPIPLASVEECLALCEQVTDTSALSWCQ